jgi:hypothetical protein
MATTAAGRKTASLQSMTAHIFIVQAIMNGRLVLAKTSFGGCEKMTVSTNLDLVIV